MARPAADTSRLVDIRGGMGDLSLTLEHVPDADPHVRFEIFAGQSELARAHAADDAADQPPALAVQLIPSEITA